MSSRLTYADKSSAVIYKTFNCGNNFLICPIFAARLCGVCITDIDNNINIVKQILIIFNIVKADKLNIKRCAAESLDNSEVRIILSVIKTVVYHMICPRTHLAPAVKHCDFLYAVRSNALNIIIKSAEFIANALNIINELGELSASFKYPP